jgi:hypothetical protein
VYINFNPKDYHLNNRVDHFNNWLDKIIATNACDPPSLKTSVGRPHSLLVWKIRMQEFDRD